MIQFPEYTKAIRVYFSNCDKSTCLYDYHVERLDMDLKCDICGFIGSYYVDGEKYKIGLCHVCLIKSNIIDKIEIGDYID